MAVLETRRGGAFDVDACDELGIVGECGQLGRREAGKHLGGVLMTLRPPDRVDAREEIPGVGVPRPVQVESKVTERSDGLGQDGADVEASDGLHGERL